MASQEQASAKPVICVFCGSNSGKSPAHLEAARSLAQALHAHGISLVYGGGTSGLMGELARTLVSLSGPDAVHGVIPAALLPLEATLREANRNGEAYDNEAAGADDTRDELLRSTTTRDVQTIDEAVFGKTTVVPDMHTRKRLMASLVVQGGPGSGFVALAGGFGTLEELMEVATWNQLGIHERGVCVFNVEGYWDSLLAWVRGAVEKGFIPSGNDGIVVEAVDAEGVVKALRDYALPDSRYKLEWKGKAI